MAVSRPILLALVGFVLVVGVFFATRGAGSDDRASEPAAPAPAPKPSASADKPAPASESAAPSADKPSTGASTSGDATADARGGAAQGPALLNKAGPARLTRALARGRLVVLFVRQPGAADDRATARSVAALRRSGPRRVTIASIPISEISDYSAITGRAGVSQAPAIVLSRRSRGRPTGLLLEGYTDPASLRQHVADALK
ncbi:MAG: hypothetical protein WD649_05460 [Thermoleophilaceae bacterium]